MWHSINLVDDGEQRLRHLKTEDFHTRTWSAAQLSRPDARVRDPDLTQNVNGACTSKRMQTEPLTWNYDGMTIELGADWGGEGP